jgi:hypothetical protein
MGKIKMLLFLTGIIVVLLIIGAILFFLLKPKVAGIYISTEPPSLVFINGEDMGTTPYRGMRDPGEVVLKLAVPGGVTVPYETRVALLPGVETVVRRTFGNSLDTSSGEIISFEKIGKEETSLAVVSTPDSAEFTIDGTARAFTPYKTSALLEGDHTIVFTARGYADKTIKVKTHKGYKLTAIVTLAKNGTGSLSETPVPSPVPEKRLTESLVEISQIAGGVLRVRTEPKTTSEELGLVESGKSYPYLDTDTSGWFKIEYESGKEGWVSSQYAKKIPNPEVSRVPSPTQVKLSPTPIPTVTPVIPG